MPKLLKPFQMVALQIQEAAAEALSHDNIRQRLSDCLRDSGGYLVDVFGDSESGEVVYYCDGDLKKATYEIGMAAGKATCAIDCENALDVVARTSYEEEAEDGDHYAAMESERLYATVPAYERFISKDERKAAPGGSFAGKGKSFPILKPGDVMAAVRSMGRAGSENFDTATLKRNIVRIAKAKGWGKSLPKAWQEAETVATTESAPLRLIESPDWEGEIELSEAAAARSDYTIKLIAPGKGSTAFYPKEVLERDGPNVFRKDTHIYWNHPTAAEEAERPEGNADHWAGVLTTDARYEENGPKGPGLYARAKVFADYGEKFAERAPYGGISIRAGGIAEPGVMREGRPLLKAFTRVESTDFVTKAGAGGLILQESAANSNTEGGESVMDQAEITKLQESVRLQAEQNRKTNQRLALYEARDFATAEIGKIRLPEATRQRLVSRVVGMAPMTAEGTLDTVAYKTIIEAEVKDEGEYLSRLNEGRVVTGMGPVADPAPVDPVKAQEAFTSTMDELGQVLGLSEAGRKSFGRVN